MAGLVHAIATLLARSYAPSLERYPIRCSESCCPIARRASVAGLLQFRELRQPPDLLIALDNLLAGQALQAQRAEVLHAE